jgi:hypothetical protein
MVAHAMLVRSFLTALGSKSSIKNGFAQAQPLGLARIQGRQCVAILKGGGDDGDGEPVALCIDQRHSLAAQLFLHRVISGFAIESWDLPHFACCEDWQKSGKFLGPLTILEGWSERTASGTGQAPGMRISRSHQGPAFPECAQAARKVRESRIRLPLRRYFIPLLPCITNVRFCTMLRVTENCNRSC